MIFSHFSEETALLHMECVQNLILLLFAAASAYLNSNKSALFKYANQSIIKALMVD